MIFSYCTLFDLNYSDKGLVMYDSFIANTKTSKLYILAMDEKVFSLLSDMNLERACIISLDAFLNDELKLIKERRTWAEFCWTCTASLIDYIFEFYGEEVCTYVDSDLFFYRNPDDLVWEMINKRKTVQIVPHGFSSMRANVEQERSSGKYCVQFNTFQNCKSAREVLKEWKEQTIVKCSYGERGECGDQIYLNEWPEKYDCVSVLENEGAGMAPWNIDRYSSTINNNGIDDVLVDKKKVLKMYFYHFHGITFVDEKSVNIHVFYRYWKIDDKLVYRIYKEYLQLIMNKRKHLKDNYGVECFIFVHPAAKSLKRSKKVRDVVTFNNMVLRLKMLLNQKKDIIKVL